jgi:hypothetical protein
MTPPATAPRLTWIDPRQAARSRARLIAFGALLIVSNLSVGWELIHLYSERTPVLVLSSQCTTDSTPPVRVVNVRWSR